MNDLLIGVVAAAVGGLLGSIPGFWALRRAKTANAISERAVAEARRANDIAANALTEAQRVREIEEAAEHRELTPTFVLKAGSSLGGNGYELILTSVDRPVDSVTLTWIKGADPAADRTVVGLTDRPAAGPVGTIGHSVTTQALCRWRGRDTRCLAHQSEGGQWGRSPVDLRSEEGRPGLVRSRLRREPSDRRSRLR